MGSCPSSCVPDCEGNAWRLMRPDSSQTDIKKIPLRDEENFAPIDMSKFRLTDVQKMAMRTCWKEVISVERRDIFHKTMLFCIEASPKLNEIIAMNRYCYRDLTKWPKLNEMCVKKYEYFDRLVMETDLTEESLMDVVDNSGRMHASYSKYGLKPHFLDIFQQQFIGLLMRLKESDKYDKQQMIQGFTLLLSFIIDRMNVTYAQAVQESRMRANEENEAQ